MRMLLSALIGAALSNSTSRASQPPRPRSFHALKCGPLLIYVSPLPTSYGSQQYAERSMKRQETWVPDLVLPLWTLN